MASTGLRTPAAGATSTRGNTFPVIVHEYEHPHASPGRFRYVYEHGWPSPAERRPNALVFIGGLGDGPHTVPYVRRAVARRLLQAQSRPGSKSGPESSTTTATAATAAAAAPSSQYAVFEACLELSAFTGWGHSSVQQDAQWISDLVRYLRTGAGVTGKIVLMGHSTGCQDCMQYATGGVSTAAAPYEPVDGFILQAPVSDRDAMTGLTAGNEEATKMLRDSVELAKKMIADGRKDDCLPYDAIPPGFPQGRATAYRWNSLMSKGGDDDFFSSDLDDDRVASIWGRVAKPVLMMLAAEDRFVPPWVKQTELIARWSGFCRPGIASKLSGLIPGASHRVDKPESQEWLADRVCRFLDELEK